MTNAHYRIQGAQAKELRKRAGKFLADCRKAADLTQVQAADRFGYQYFTMVSQIEQGRTWVPPEDWTKWAEVYGQDRREFAKKLLSFYDPHVYRALFGEEKMGEKNAD